MVVSPFRVGRIVESIFEAARRPVPRRVAVALSGGVDSMCLTHLLKLGLTNTLILAITVDHRLRHDSSQEARKIHEYVTEKLGVEHTVSTLSWTTLVSKDFEAVAREKRYEAIRQVCESQGIDTVFVGHTLDDQLETYLLRDRPMTPSKFTSEYLYEEYRKNRVFGEAAIHKLAPFPFPLATPKGSFDSGSQISVCRPLLEFSKLDLVETCKANGISYFEDSSNFDASITHRNEIRRQLEVMDPLLKRAILSKVQEARQATEAHTDQISKLEKQLKEKRWISKLPVLGALSLKLPRTVVLDLDSPVFNRLIYNNMRGLSASTNYHYKFMRMYDMHSRVREFTGSTSKRLSLQYLNMTFEVHKDTSYIYMNARRQPPIKGSLSSILVETTDHWSNWICWDHRIYFRFRSTKKETLSLHPFKLSSDYQQLSWETGFDHRFVKNVAKLADNYCLPILKTENGKVLGFPGLYAPPELEIEVGFK